MQCPKCGHANPGDVQFCTQCHSTLRFKCPQCWQEQTHGGTCDKCGADFAQYQGVYLAKVLGESAKETADAESQAGRVAEVITAATSPWAALWLVCRALLARIAPRLLGA